MFLFQFALTQFPDGVADNLVSVQLHSAALLSFIKTTENVDELSVFLKREES